MWAFSSVGNEPKHCSRDPDLVLPSNPLCLTNNTPTSSSDPNFLYKILKDKMRNYIRQRPRKAPLPSRIGLRNKFWNSVSMNGSHGRMYVSPSATVSSNIGLEVDFRGGDCWIGTTFGPLLRLEKWHLPTPSTSSTVQSILIVRLSSVRQHPQNISSRMEERK